LVINIGQLARRIGEIKKEIELLKHCKKLYRSFVPRKSSRDVVKTKEFVMLNIHFRSYPEPGASKF
jgi:hypothetical protein